MCTLNLDKEWNFVRREITSSNKGGTKEGEMLFEFQVLLSTLRRVRNPREKRILSSIYQKHKKRYSKN